MKKIYWLNSMINFFWIISFITIPIAFIAMVGVFFMDNVVESDGITMRINGNSLTFSEMPSKIYFSLNMMVYLVLIYIVFLFKKLVATFMKAQLFDDKVISIFNKVGVLLLTSGLVLMISTFVYRMYSQGEMTLEFGVGQNGIMIFMGIFFMVLSEIFTISKNMKTENDLTI